MLEELADFIPRTEAPALIGERLHKRIHDEPACENDDEADGDIHEYLFCAGYLIASNAREIEPTCPCKKYCREEDGDINARIEDVLGDGGKVADGLAPTDTIAACGHDLPRQWIRGERNGRHDDENKDEEREAPYQLSASHENIVACGKIRHTVHCCVGGRVVKCTWL